MKYIMILSLFSSLSLAEGLTVEEQKNLIEENKMLREEIKKLQSKDQAPDESAKMMEALKKGQKYQEDQNKALEELDKED